MSSSVSKASVDVPVDANWQSSAWRSRVRRRLLDWFADAARTLPWRSDPQPYHVWVSEIMCQQTQVATVLPYFARFMKAYPRVADLADARESDLMKLWEGLGYYRRARSLHAAAKQIVARHDGVFPTDFDDVMALPGIGRYTAGAILSISANRRVPILEGNTQRVFSRWVALRSPPTDPAANRLLWTIAETMLPPERHAAARGSGAFNQAAMELGALICKSKTPRCDQCPVASLCAANRSAMQDDIPGKVTKITYENRDEFAFIIRDRRQRFVMRPAPAGGRWAGLWDFPRPLDPDVKNLQSALAWLRQQFGPAFAAGTCLSTIRHGVTKYRIRLTVHEATVADENPSPEPRTPSVSPPWRFVSLSEMKDLPLSVTGRKIARLLQSRA